MYYAKKGTTDPVLRTLDFHPCDFIIATNREKNEIVFWDYHKKSITSSLKLNEHLEILKVKFYDKGHKVFVITTSNHKYNVSNAIMLNYPDLTICNEHSYKCYSVCKEACDVSEDGTCYLISFHGGQGCIYNDMINNEAHKFNKENNLINSYPVSATVYDHDNKVIISQDPNNRHMNLLSFHALEKVEEHYIDSWGAIVRMEYVPNTENIFFLESDLGSIYLYDLSNHCVLWKESIPGNRFIPKHIAVSKNGHYGIALWDYNRGEGWGILIMPLYQNLWVMFGSGKSPSV